MLPDRKHADGRHFRLMRAIAGGSSPAAPTTELADLMRWGYLSRDGDTYKLTPEGRRVHETWEGLEQL